MTSPPLLSLAFACTMIFIRGLQSIFHHTLEKTPGKWLCCCTLLNIWLITALQVQCLKFDFILKKFELILIALI